MTPTPAPVGIGIVGCGGAAVDVTAAIGRLPAGCARVAATHDLRPELAAELAATWEASVHPTLDGLLTDPAVAMVYVALPHDLLPVVAERALEAGRPVLVEKPMAIEVATIERLGALATRRGLALGVLFELRETGPARVARRLLAEGAIGDLTAVRIRTLIDKPQAYWASGLTGRAGSPWRASAARAGGGVVLMNTIHQLDLLLFITGLTVERVRGEIGTLMTDPGQVEVEDTAAATIRFTNGAIGSLVAAAHSPGAEGEETIELDGRFGSLRLPDLYGSDHVAIHLRRAHGDLPAGRWTTITAEPADPFRDALDAFIGAVAHGRPAPVGAADAARAVAVVHALYHDASASQLERRPV